MTLNDKVQVGNSTTSTGATTASQWQTYTEPKAERGWECPRCGRINAPWVRQCDCPRDNLTTITWTSPSIGTDEWWKTYVTCNGTSASTQLDSDTFKVHPENDPKYQVNGSDYWNPSTKAWENVSTNISNLQKEIDDLKLNYKIEEIK